MNQRRIKGVRSMPPPEKTTGNEELPEMIVIWASVPVSLDNTQVYHNSF
jgi:hypothetical protein